MSWESFWTTMPNCSALAMKSPICWLAWLRAIVCRLACRCCVRTMEKTLKTENIRMMTITAVTLNFISGRKSPGSFSFILITSNCRLLLFFLLL